MADLSIKQLPLVERERLLKLATAMQLRRPQPEESSIAVRPEREWAPLSFAQQPFWIVAQLKGTTRANHISVHLRLAGELDKGALHRALDRIRERHEVLRATFSLRDDAPVQVIAPSAGGFALREDDLRGHPEAEARLAHLLEEAVTTDFDLQSGPPIRGRLVAVGDGEHLLMLTVHHIVFDGWSTGVLMRELGALYSAFREGRTDPLPPLAIQYPDYAVWQRRRLSGEALRAQREYWQQLLAGASTGLSLPTDRPRPAQQDEAGGVVVLEFDERLTDELVLFSQRHAATLFVTLLSAWAVLLMRLSGQKDIVVGTAMAGRTRAEIEPLIGCFLNTLPLRLDLSGTATVAQIMQRVRERVVAAQSNQEVPLVQLLESMSLVRGLPGAPVFQALFNWQDDGRSGEALAGLAVSPIVHQLRVARSTLTLELTKSDNRIRGEVEYARASFERSTVERYCGYLRNVLVAMVTDEQQRIDRLRFLDHAERERLLVQWNATEAEYPRSRCIHELFEAQVERTPHAVAVIHERQQLDYAELNARANRLAHYLRAQGVGPGERVGLYLERGVEMVVGIFGVLKAGGAYVPLDPDYPSERLQYMLRDAAPRVVLTQAGLTSELASSAVPVVALDRDWADIERCEAGNPDARTVALTSAHLAYVIYTSGSTGTPKGVMVEHRNVVNELLSQAAQYGSTAEHRILQFASTSFDASVEEILSLALGASLVLCGEAWLRSRERFIAACETYGVSRLALTVPFWERLVRYGGMPASVRCVIIGGEAASRESMQAWFELEQPRPQLYNAYGPTETTICAARFRCDADDGRSPPIGRPIANVRIYLLDEQLEPVPQGAAGEIYIGGAGVARGYLNRADLTAQRFVADPYAARAGARMYRTGDVGRYLPDGNLEYLGRNDLQVKIRGYRIELGEIEARLCEHAGIREAVVIAREEQGDKRLVAYYRASGEATVSVESLRNHLGMQLPEYMVPAAYVEMEQWPLTPNGKLDRTKLPAPDGDSRLAREYEPPEGETEEILARLWSELLKVERVGRHDNFFELGGHSLLVVSLVERMRGAGLRAEVQTLFTAPTLMALAGAAKVIREVEL